MVHFTDIPRGYSVDDELNILFQLGNAAGRISRPQPDGTHTLTLESVDGFPGIGAVATLAKMEGIGRGWELRVKGVVWDSQQSSRAEIRPLKPKERKNGVSVSDAMEAMLLHVQNLSLSG